MQKDILRKRAMGYDGYSHDKPPVFKVCCGQRWLGGGTPNQRAYY